MTGKMMHHDSITGTSLIYIIYNETVAMQALLEKNAQTLQHLFAANALRNENLKLEELTLCTHYINNRNLCPEPKRARRTQENGHSFVLMVYNPSVKVMNEINFKLPYSTFTVQSFDNAKQQFKDVISSADLDTFCNEDPNHQLECDVHLFRTVYPLSY